MPRYKHQQEVDPDVMWEEIFYDGILIVRGGYVETDDPIHMDGLLYRGYTLVEEAQPSDDEDDDEE